MYNEKEYIYIYVYLIIYIYFLLYIHIYTQRLNMETGIILYNNINLKSLMN